MRLDREAWHEAWTVFAWSRLLAFALGIYEWLRLPAGTFRGPAIPEQNVLMHAFDGWPAAGVFRALFEPLTLWDGSIYVAISQGGYTTMLPFNDGAAAATHAVFFPLYPGLVRVVSLFLDSTAAVILAAYAVSFVTFLAALYLLHRLTALELGTPAARATLLLLAFAPTAFIFGAPFTESLFLLCSVASLYAARNGRWALAGIAAGAAAATRNSGLFLLLPLVVMYFWGPRADGPPSAEPLRFLRIPVRYRLRPNILWLSLAPLALGAYMLYLNQKFGDPLAWVHGQKVHERIGATPWKGLWDSIKAAWDPLRGHPAFPYFDFGSLNVLNLGAFAVACGALVGVFRRLPIAYGLYVVPGLLFPLTDPWPVQPIASFPRYMLSLFPLFMWAGWACERRRLTEKVVAVFAAGFGVLLIQFASGLFTV